MEARGLRPSYIGPPAPRCYGRERPSSSATVVGGELGRERLDFVTSERYGSVSDSPTSEIEAREGSRSMGVV